MTLVDVSSISAALFVTGAIFIMLIFGLLSFGIVKMFELKFRAGTYSFIGALVSGVAFGIILSNWSF